MAVLISHTFRNMLRCCHIKGRSDVHTGGVHRGSFLAALPTSSPLVFQTLPTGLQLLRHMLTKVLEQKHCQTKQASVTNMWTRASSDEKRDHNASTAEKSLRIIEKLERRSTTAGTLYHPSTLSNAVCLVFFFKKELMVLVLGMFNVRHLGNALRKL